MIEKVKQYIFSNDLITSDNRHLFAAVSGGVDSCVLVHILNHLKTELGYRLHILHFNHRTRGNASDEDQKFVEKLADSYGLDIRIGVLPPEINKMTETALRDERYRFFNKVLSRYPDAVIATGHNRDDNIETFFMRLSKGSRLKGLMGIMPKRNRFIRPLLPLLRKEIEDYAAENQLEFRIDKTNEDRSILRNNLRHNVLPFLRKQLESNLDDNLAKVIRDLSLYHSIYEEKLKEAIVSSTKRSKTGISLNRKRYQHFNEAVRRGLIEYCISNIFPLNYTVSDRNFVIWERFITQAKSGKKHSFLENGMAVSERSLILFGDLPEDRVETYRMNLGQPLIIDDKYTISLD